MNFLKALQKRSAVRLHAVTRALVPLASHAASGGFVKTAPAAARRTALAGAAQCCSASAGVILRGVAVSRRVPLRVRGAAAAAGAVTLFAVPPSFAAAEAAKPELSPPKCALQLRDLVQKIAVARKMLQKEVDHVANHESYYRESLQEYEQELAIYAMCLNRCVSTGDAAGVASYKAEIKKTEENKQSVLSMVAILQEHQWQPDVKKCSDELAHLERTHKLLREYVLDQHGAEWLAKAESSLVSDDELRKQARAWRSEEMPPSK